MGKKLKPLTKYTAYELYNTLKETLKVYHVSIPNYIDSDSAVQDCIVYLLIQFKAKELTDFFLVEKEERIPAGTTIIAKHRSGIVEKLVLIQDLQHYRLMKISNHSMWNDYSYENTLESLNGSPGQWTYELES